MRCDQENASLHLMMAEIARGSQVVRIHTQYNNAGVNVVTYGIRDKLTVMHIMRRGTRAFDYQIVNMQQRYSMSNAISEARAILDTL
jgi:hypothetical protein